MAIMPQYMSVQQLDPCLTFKCKKNTQSLFFHSFLPIWILYSLMIYDLA